MPPSLNKTFFFSSHFHPLPLPRDEKRRKYVHIFLPTNDTPALHVQFSAIYFHREGERKRRARASMGWIEEATSLILEMYDLMTARRRLFLARVCSQMHKKEEEGL